MNPPDAQSPEARLLLAALVPPSRWPENVLVGLLDRPGFDADYLGRLAAQHGAAGFVARAMEAAGIPVPDSIRLQARAIRVRNLMLATALVELMQRLEAAGIRALSFKGPALSSLLYGDAGLRPSNDLDVLVAPGDMKAAECELVALGFCPDGPAVHGSTPLPAPHHHRFSRGGVVVELHRRLYSEAITPAPFDELWSNRQAVLLGSYPIPVPGFRDLVKYLAIHGARHGFVCLKWLADLATIVTEQPGLDWDGLVAELQGTVDETAFLQGFGHVADSLGLEIPDPLRRAALRLGSGLDRAKRVRSIWFAERAGEFTVSVHRLRLLPWKIRVQRFLAILFTPGPRDWAVLPGLTSRFPLVFRVIRPFRLGWNVGWSTFQHHVLTRPGP